LKDKLTLLFALRQARRIRSHFKFFLVQALDRMHETICHFFQGSDYRYTWPDAIQIKGSVYRITLNGGPGGLEGVLPNEKHEFSAGSRAAQKGGPAGCTTGQASGLHIKLAYGKGWAGGLPFSPARPALFHNLMDRLLCSPLARPSVFSAARRKFTFFIWKYGPPARRHSN